MCLCKYKTGSAVLLNWGDKRKADALETHADDAGGRPSALKRKADADDAAPDAKKAKTMTRNAALMLIGRRQLLVLTMECDVSNVNTQLINCWMRMMAFELLVQIVTATHTM